MKQFTSVHDAGNLDALVSEALQLKANVNACAESGKGKTVGLLFLIQV